jgi:hypothetical protein
MVVIVSESYAARMHESPPARPPDLLISVTEARVPAALADVPVAFLAGLPEKRAADTLIDRLNGRRLPEAELATSTLSYPGGDRAQVQNIPTRNPNFTGRDKDLRQLRDELRTRRGPVFQPLVSARPRSRWSTRIASAPITTSSGGWIVVRRNTSTRRWPTSGNGCTKNSGCPFPKKAAFPRCVGRYCRR